MEENFRSNARIVERADHFIRKNTLRHKKEMHATREPQQDVHVIELGTVYLSGKGGKWLQRADSGFVPG